MQPFFLDLDSKNKRQPMTLKHQWNQISQRKQETRKTYIMRPCSLSLSFSRVCERKRLRIRAYTKKELVSH